VLKLGFFRLLSWLYRRLISRRYVGLFSDHNLSDFENGKDYNKIRPSQLNLYKYISIFTTCFGPISSYHKVLYFKLLEDEYYCTINVSKSKYFTFYKHDSD
jgi:hypothetical protein